MPEDKHHFLKHPQNKRLEELFLPAKSDLGIESMLNPRYFAQQQEIEKERIKEISKDAQADFDIKTGWADKDKKDETRG